MRRFNDLDEVVAAAGTHIGTGEWLEITQERIDLFADATDDRQWIHVDPQRAATGPYGTTIAHGFLTLSLLPRLLQTVFEVDRSRGVNYGLNRVRFPAPLPVGGRVRARADLADAVPIDGGVQVVVSATIEHEGSDRPVCVAEIVARFYR